MWIRLITIGIVASACCLGCMDRHPKADLVIFNGNIYTVNQKSPKAEALAVKDGKIVYIGNNLNANNWTSDTTQIIDLHGATLVPGFIEGHGHLMDMGLALRHLDLSSAKSYKEIIELVGQKALNAKKGQWIIGSGWHQEKWSDPADTLIRGFPVHDSLSLVTKNNPVILYHASHHALLANKKAMSLAKIKSGVSSPKGGQIIQDGNGDATGIFTDNAMKLIEQLVPNPTDEELIESLNLAFEECLRNGITSFQSAGERQKVINLLHSFLKNDLLKMRVYVMIDGADETLVQNWFTHGPSIGLGNNFLTIRSIKLVADGALGSRTALLLNDYWDAAHEQGSRVTELDQMMRITNKAFNKGFQICTHAIGDRANKETLDLYEIILKTDTTKKDVRFRIEHAQHLAPEDIPRFGQLGILPSVQTIHLSSDRPWAIDRLGEQRIKSGAYMWKSLLNQGAKLINGTDVPVEPVNPIANFYAAITRKTLDGKPEKGFEPEQRLSRDEALLSMTLNAAYGAFEENLKGSIELDKVADFTVLDQDIMTVSEDDILKTKVLYTIIDGKIVYADNQAL